MDDIIQHSDFEKWQSDSPSACFEILSKEESNLKLGLEGRYESFEPLIEENSIANQGQKDENIEDNVC